MDSRQEAKIQKLIYLALQQIKPKSKIAKKMASLYGNQSIKDFEETAEVSEIAASQSFNGFNIAAYHGVRKSQLRELIDTSEASYIELSSQSEDLASYSSIIDEEFSCKIAGDILMEAKDNNADFLLVKNETTKEFFDKNQEKMEKLTGRELRMSVVSQKQFVQLLNGEKDVAKLGFNTHKVAVSFLA